MKLWKRIAAMVLASLLALGTLVGCGGKTGDNSAASEGGKYKIGVVLKSLANPFYVTMADAIEAKGEELGVEIVLQAPEKETDAEKQMQIIENLITQQVDAILLTPNGSTEMAPAAKKCNDAGIPIVIVDTRLDAAALEENGATTASFIGSDNYFGGQLAAEEMKKAIGEGKVAILEGIGGQESSVNRVSGFTDKAKELGGLDIVASQPADWDQEKGYTVFQNILQANPDINGLFAANDMMALGAVKAIEDAGLEGKITVIGFDATDDAKEAIKAGKMLGSIAQSPADMGTTALTTALDFLEKGSCEEDIAVEVYMLAADAIE